MTPVPLQLQSKTRARRGFTLVEVLISIAIALVLILGISQIFSIAQRTTGAGTQVLTDSEFNRGIQQMLLNDARGITNTVGDSPALSIVSYPQAAFRSRVDQQQDYDGKPNTQNDPANPGQSLAQEPIFTIDDRIHRTDVFCFFARGQFTRRTGDSGDATSASVCSLSSPTTSGEAFIWYGHLALPDNNEISGWNYLTPGANTTSNPPGQFWNPGSGTAALNPNNFFASDWILGRQVLLLSPASANAGQTYIKGLSYGKNPLLLPTPNSSVANDINGTPIYASRYDLVDASIAGYRNFPGPSSSTWWDGLTGYNINSGPPQQTRFDGNPFARKPTAGASPTVQLQQLSAAIAQSSPIFVRGCSQFIVEFAGDYVTQNANGVVGTVNASGQTTNGGSDGQIDYVVDPTTGAHQIRWYGFPRDTTGAGLNPYANVNSGAVLPVSYVLSNAGPTAVTPPAGWTRFERGTVPTASTTWQTNASTTNGLPAVYAGASGNPTPYICAWGPDTDGSTAGNTPVPRPKMIRITIGIDDPSGHLNTQQIYEYVLNLP